MSTDKGQTFIEWLDAQEDLLGYTDYEVAKIGEFSHSALSRARIEGIPPGWKICVKMAEVFKCSPITVFRKAGLLPPGPDDEINLEDWKYLLEQMTQAEREEFWQIGLMKVNLRQKHEQAARATKFKPEKA